MSINFILVQFLILCIINITTTFAADAFSNFITLPSSKFNIQTYARTNNFANNNFMKNPRSIRSITHISNGILYIITYVTPKEVVPANNRLVNALIDINGDGTIDIFQPILSTWEDPSDFMYTELAPTSIAIDYSGNNQNVYFTTYISTLLCKNVHDQVIAMIDRKNDRLDMNQCEIYFNWESVTGKYFKFDNGDHGRHYAAINRLTNNELCIAMGSDCDLCDACSDPTNDPSPGCQVLLPQTQLLCCPIDNNGSPLNSINECTVKAEGLRNSVGFDFHPKDNHIWWTENQQGRDHCDDKLNRISFDGEHFGFPYCEAFGIGDSAQQQIRNIGGVDVGYQWRQSRFIKDNGLLGNVDYVCDRFTPPIQAMGAHGVPMGMRFYNLDSISPFAPYKFPKEYHGSIFVAARGRGSTLNIGWSLARVLNIKLNDERDFNKITDFDVFADGWQNPDTAKRVGRPQDVEILPDGSLLIGDEIGDIIFRVTYLRDEPSLNPATDCTKNNRNSWISLPELPAKIGEVVSGIIDNVLYVAGQGISGATESETYAFGFRDDEQEWKIVAPRIYKGNHQEQVIINNEWWLIGGFGDNSAGKVQIYNPSTNTWREKESLPWNVGSVCATLIKNKIYVCGGIIDKTSITQNQCAFYDLNNEDLGWQQSMANMPIGRNHAATGTDGIQMYVFGGRDGGNRNSDGFNDVQIYTPSTNTWQIGITTFPVARGGMGKAVYYDGLFYIFGGETLTDTARTGSDRTYDRVDIYNPTTNKWSTGTPMISARHGIFPVARDSNGIYIAGGGVKSGNSQSVIFDKYCPLKGSVQKSTGASPPSSSPPPSSPTTNIPSILTTTFRPSLNPSFAPSDNPSISPTNNPSMSPVPSPTNNPIIGTLEPTSPSSNPSVSPTDNPVNIIIGDSSYCCLAAKAPNWNGRCWKHTNEQDCNGEPKPGVRCYWDPNNCLSNPPICLFRGEICQDPTDCCSDFCRFDVTPRVCR